VVAVTDGENSHPGSDATLTAHLAQRRIRESQLALRRLGWADPVVTRLHLPDGRVTTHRPQLQAALEEILRPGDWCVAPWRRDGHPDHDACGEAAQRASHSAGVRMLGYLVWTWHWATPDGSEIPWQSCQQLRLSRRERARKRWATSAFESQIDSIGSSPSDAPVLPAPVLRRFWRAYEVYVDEIGGPRDVY